MTYRCFSAELSAESVAAITFIVCLHDQHRHIDCRLHNKRHLVPRLRYAFSIPAPFPPFPPFFFIISFIPFTPCLLSFAIFLCREAAFWSKLGDKRRPLLTGYWESAFLKSWKVKMRIMGLQLVKSGTKTKYDEIGYSKIPNQQFSMCACLSKRGFDHGIGRRTSLSGNLG